MEPTADEIVALKTLSDLADWADLPEVQEGEEAGQSARLSFYKLLGATPTTKTRTIAAIPSETFDRLVSEWRIGDDVPSPVLLASVGLVGTAARIACGVTMTAAMKQVEREKQESAELEKLKAQAAVAAAVASKAQAKAIKLSTVLDQANDGEVVPLEQTEVDKAYEVYKSKMGDYPRPEEDLTPEQLAGLKALFSSGAPPYVDLAVWGPFGRRIQKKLKLSGLVMGADGVLQQTQLYGPPNVEEWSAGFAVFRTGAIMLGQISPATLDLWSKAITSYASRYGQEIWALVYQTDVRARLEHMERVRRTGTAARAAALAAGGVHAFDPEAPWEWVFRQTAEDSQFWRRELEEPALLVKTRADKMHECIEGDAPLGRAKRPAHSPAAPGQPHKKQRRMDRQDKSHIMDSDGFLTHNRRGVVLCQDYQKGDCPDSLGGGKCPKNSGHVHQCSKCLLMGHGRNQCTSASTRRDVSKGSGKGSKGKGKNKSKQYQ